MIHRPAWLYLGFSPSCPFSRVRGSVSSSRHFARSLRISLTTRSCTLRVKAYWTYPIRAAFDDSSERCSDSSGGKWRGWKKSGASATSTADRGGGHDFPGHPQALDVVVPGGLVGDNAKRRGPARWSCSGSWVWGSYVTAWTWLHKFRRAMVRPGRNRLVGRVEVDETYVGGVEEGVRGRDWLAKR